MDLVQAQIRIAGGASLADLGLAKQVSMSPYDGTGTAWCSMQPGDGRTCRVAKLYCQSHVRGK